MTERNVSSENFSFLTSDAEYNILEKIRNNPTVKYLAGNADFALGIVTGNNKEYISNICKYHINPTENYIIFKPESFQQIAPTEMYRSPEKLLYRFISSQLVFAYDDKQTLSLNSCNIVIPKLQGAKTKYVLAILNSRIAQFIYKMEFNSVKVLRSHIENIPIPIIEKEKQDVILGITERLISSLPLDEAQKTYDELDQHIFEVFNLTQSEQDIIKNAVDGDNKFLA